MPRAMMRTVSRVHQLNVGIFVGANEVCTRAAGMRRVRFSKCIYCGKTYLLSNGNGIVCSSPVPGSRLLGLRGCRRDGPFPLMFLRRGRVATGAHRRSVS